MSDVTAKCKSCGSENVEDVSTYNDTVFAAKPVYRFKCRSCGKHTTISVKEAK